MTSLPKYVITLNIKYMFNCIFLVCGVSNQSFWKENAMSAPFQNSFRSDKYLLCQKENKWPCFGNAIWRLLADCYHPMLLVYVSTPWGTLIMFWYQSGMGVAKPTSSLSLFSQFFTFIKLVVIYGISRCGDICQMWMWFDESNIYFCKIDNFANGESNERSFSTPTADPVSRWLQFYDFTRSGIDLTDIFR